AQCRLVTADAAALQRFESANVRFGSVVSSPASSRHVCFGPKSGQLADYFGRSAQAGSCTATNEMQQLMLLLRKNQPIGDVHPAAVKMDEKQHVNLPLPFDQRLLEPCADGS